MDVSSGQIDGRFSLARTGVLVLFIAIRQRPASGAEWHDHRGILNSNGFAVIRFSLKHDGVPWPPQAPCSSKLMLAGRCFSLMAPAGIVAAHIIIEHLAHPGVRRIIIAVGLRNP
jgi:hypothetical protein